MSDSEALLFKSDSSTVATFSKMPVIRNFESLLTDEELESAGLKVEHHPKKNTFFIYPAAKLIRDKHQNAVLSETLISHRCVPSHTLFYVDEVTPTAASAPGSAELIERLEQLRELAGEEDIPFHEASAQEALEWVRLTAPARLPAAFLVNNGNTRLLWQSATNQLGIQFLGNGSAQFVFLGKDDQTERVFGTVKISELMKFVSGLDVAALLGF